MIMKGSRDVCQHRGPTITGLKELVFVISMIVDIVGWEIFPLRVTLEIEFVLETMNLCSTFQMRKI